MDQQDDQQNPEEIDLEIDDRNSKAGIGFIDIMGFKIRQKEND